MGPADTRIEALCERADALRERGELREALALYKQAYLRDTTDFELRERIAEVLGDLGDVPRAVRTYRLVASHFASIGRLFDAIAICQKILALDPDHGETQAALAKLYCLTAAHEEVVTVVSADEAQQDANDLGLSSEQRLSSDRREIEIASLPEIPLFSALPREAFVSAVNRVRLRRTGQGERVIHEGDEEYSMFIVVAGSFTISRSGEAHGDGPTVDTLGAGDFFGEMSLIADAPRLSSVYSDGDGLLLELGRESYLELSASFPSFAALVERHFRARLVANLIRVSPIFRGFSEPARGTLIDHCTIEVTEAGTTLLARGRSSEAVFLLLRGECDVSHADDAELGAPRMVEGDLFGEISAVFETPCTATVRARTPCTLLRIDPRAFRELVASHPEAAKMIHRLAGGRLKRTARLVRALA